ncbi:MAG: hypothetical protein WAM39_33000, partial [Bryobacteraceae bacterium]
NSFLSLPVISMRRGGRAIPQVWAKTFPAPTVLLEIPQAVNDLANPLAPSYAERETGSQP